MHQRQTQSSEPPEFPGCKPVPLPRAAIERFEGRLEYWDATTEIAWICEPTTSYHERPARLLTRLAEVIARVRGSHVECYGSMDLLLRDARGEPYRIMQADESLYLHPAHARLPGAAMVVGEDDFPDVVLEVDHTTDARRGKLPLYESWGFPEVWVDVPDAPSPSRPRARRPGLTIHPLEDGRDRVAAESPAFPGWTAAEIHEALNGAAPSARTSVVLERVGGVQGAREGTGPDDDPLLRSQRRQGFERGHAEGHAEGLIEGVRNARAEMVRHILVSRGIGYRGLGGGPRRHLSIPSVTAAPPRGPPIQSRAPQAGTGDGACPSPVQAHDSADACHTPGATGAVATWSTTTISSMPCAASRWPCSTIRKRMGYAGAARRGLPSARFHRAPDHRHAAGCA